MLVYLAGDLSSDESCRRLVPDVIWQRLKYYFPCAPEFQAVHPVCRSCQVRIVYTLVTQIHTSDFLKMFFLTTQAEDEEERQKNETYKLLASEQRAAVSQLYLDRNRPSFDNDVSNIFNSVKFSRKSSSSRGQFWRENRTATV